MNVKYAKWLGPFGAIFAGAAQVFAGGVVNGGGITAAALSPASVLSVRQ